MASSPLAESPADATSSSRPFVLAPFRGLRFDEQAVGDLGSVISPPYDVLDAETVRDLEAANRQNIVRLILSRRYARPYQAVRKRLETWRRKGYLRPDDSPGLYLYQYAAGGVTVRGLIGLVALREESERVVLPHEDVMPAPVQDRCALMRATETNLEPILMVHEGSSALRDLLEEASSAPPAMDFLALDGSHHQLWPVTDQDQLREIAAELGGTQALIADGHHRYAAYQHMQAELRDPGLPDDASPWDFGLAMLVDQHDYPLTVGPIHRSVAALTIADVAELSADRQHDVEPCPSRADAFRRRDERGADEYVAAFVITDGQSWAVLTVPRHHEVDAAVLHDEVFDSWHVTEEQIGYHHSLEQALHATARQPGIVVAVTPPDLRQVMDAAARGARMPRKSTSFSPKPRMGVVMRDLRDS